MSYSEITFADRNPVKRWLQRSRLETAMQLSGSVISECCTACDYGAGNGELSRMLLQKFPGAQVQCFEPADQLMIEAKELLGDCSRLRFFSEASQIDSNSVDILFCLEVFEHLPEPEMKKALSEIQRILRPDGIAIIGVPVEVGIPAFYKGLFRMVRRYGQYDAVPRNIIKSIAGFPPKDRPISEISPGVRFHFEHMGFDYREFSRVLSEYFLVDRTVYSPFSFMGFLMPEIYFVMKLKE